jgi:DNA polymerase III alpha subunit
MINRVKKSVTKNGRSAGQQMAMITLEDLEGQIDGVLFAETFADVVKRYPDSVALEQIVFLRGKIDKRRETPSIMVNDVIPISDAIGKLTTSLGLTLDPTRHAPAITAELDPLLRRHKGNAEVYIQVATAPNRRVVMRLDRERFVKPTQLLKEDLERLLGGDAVQFSGAGTRRKKKTVQEALFQEEKPEAEMPPEEMASDSLETVDA